MINQHEFKLENIEDKINGVERKLDFGKDEGKLFRYKDFSAMQAERFAMKFLRFIPQDIDIKRISEDSSNYDAATIALMNSAEFNVLTNPECVEFLNSELKRFELYNKVTDKYESLDIEKMESGEQIEEISTFSYLRAKLLEAFTGFFSKGNS